MMPGSNLDKNLQKGFRQIEDLCEKFHVRHDVIDKAKQIFRKVEESGQLKGKNAMTKVAATVFLANNQSKVPKEVQKLLKASGVRKRDLTKCYRKIKEITKINDVLTPEQCIRRINE